MAGFLGMFNFEKPGRGIEKDAPQKRGFFMFFDILLRRFWRIMTLSLSYTLLSVPQIVIFFFVSLFLQAFLGFYEDASVTIYVSIYATLFFTCFLGMGPSGAGHTYVLRNFARDDHSWPWEDCWSNYKSNFRQSIAVFLLDIVVVSVLVGAAWLYLSGALPLPLPPIVTACFGLLALLALLVYIMMHSFLYVLMVTFDMKLGTLFRTAFSMTMAKLLPCMLLYAIAAGVFALFMALYFVNTVFIALFAALGFSLVWFICTYYATTAVDAFKIEADRRAGAE